MVTKITVHLDPIDLNVEQIPHWKYISDLVNSFTDFPRYRQNLGPFDKPVIFHHSKALSFNTIYNFVLNYFFSENRIYAKHDEESKYYLKFLSRLSHLRPHDAHSESPSFLFDEFIDHLKKTQGSSYKPVNEIILRVLGKIFVNRDNNPPTLAHLVDPFKTHVVLTQAELFANIHDIYDYIRVILPSFKEEYLKDSCELLNKPCLNEFKSTRDESITQLTIIHRMIEKLHRFYYLSHSNPSYNRYMAELKAEFIQFINFLVPGFSNNKGLFYKYLENDIKVFKIINLCYKNDAFETALQKGYRPQDPKLIPILSSLNVKELGDLTTYLQIHNRHYDLFFATLVTPLTDLLLMNRQFMELEKSDRSAIPKLLRTKRIPRFANLHLDQSIQEILERLDIQDHPAPKEDQKRSSGDQIDLPSQSQTLADEGVAENDHIKADPIQEPKSDFDIFPKKSALRNAYVYRLDLQHMPTMDLSAKAYIAANLCHRVIEQVISDKIFCEKGDDVRQHHLHFLASNLTQKNELEPLLPTIQKLYAANVWTEQTHNTLLKLKKSNRPIPPLLQQLSDCNITESSIDALINEVLDQTSHLSRQKQINGCFDVTVKFTSCFDFNDQIDQLLTKLHPESSIHAYLMEFKKDSSILKSLESTLSQSVTSRQLPLIVRFSAKIHHALLQHLLQAIYTTHHYEDLKEHNLLKLIELIRWQHPISADDKAEVQKYYTNIHHLSSYPFDADSVQGPLHQLILESIIYAGDPQLKKDLDNGFDIKAMHFGPLVVTFKNSNTSDILNNSKSLVNKIIQYLLIELEEQLK